MPGLPADALTVMNQPAYVSAQWFVSVRDLATGASVVSRGPITPIIINQNIIDFTRSLSLGQTATITMR